VTASTPSIYTVAVPELGTAHSKATIGDEPMVT